MAVAVQVEVPKGPELWGASKPDSLVDLLGRTGVSVATRLVGNIGRFAGRVGEIGLDLVDKVSSWEPFGLLERFEDTIVHPLDGELDRLA
jgi:hypothetical protein